MNWFKRSVCMKRCPKPPIYITLLQLEALNQHKQHVFFVELSYLNLIKCHVMFAFFPYYFLLHGDDTKTLKEQQPGGNISPASGPVEKQQPGKNEWLKCGNGNIDTKKSWVFEKKKTSLFQYLATSSCENHRFFMITTWDQAVYNSKISRKRNTNQLSNHLAKWNNILIIFQLVVSSQLKNIYSQIGSSPQVRVKIKNVWNHHLVFHQPRFPENEGRFTASASFLGAQKLVWGSRANLTRNI